MDLMLPTWLKLARVGFRPLDWSGVSVPEFSGIIRTGSRGGDRLAATLEFTPTATSSVDSEMERATLISFLADLEGKQNRAYLTNPARRLRGSFPASELMADNTFASGGTSNYTIGADYTATVHDRQVRLLRSAVTGAASAIRKNTTQMGTLTQHASHVFRAMVLNGRGNIPTNLQLRAGSTNGGNEYGSVIPAVSGLLTLPFVSLGTAISVTLRDNVGSGVNPGDYIDVPYFSLSRSIEADNGGNILLQSDDFTTTWANTRSTDAANATAAPDGTTTADSIIEDATASNTHYIEQTGITISSAVAEYAVMIPVKAGTRSWCRIALIETTGSSSINSYFNVGAGVGAVGTTATGANWSNLRAFIVDLGGGWYGCCLVGRKTNAATGLTVRLLLATGDGVDSYSGDGASLLYAWRATLKQSSFPGQLVATTTSAAAAVAQTGRAINVKGLPVSTNALLKKDDEVEIITSFGSELKIVTAPLNSDAAGRGHLQFKPALRGVLPDSATIIVHEPMGRFVFSGDQVGWDHEPGLVTRASAEFQETA